MPDGGTRPRSNPRAKPGSKAKAPAPPGVGRPAWPERSGRPAWPERSGRPAWPERSGRPSLNGHTPVSRNSDGKRKRRHNWFWRYRRVWFLFGLVVFTGLAGAAWVIVQIPLPSEVPLAKTTLIYDGAGNLLAELHGVENRYPVSIDQVPVVTQQAVIAAEDRNFGDHRGVDPWGIMRATWADIREKGTAQGGSTITQQYVKNQVVGSERTLVRKLKEAVVAIKLERKYDKTTILEKYLNTVYFGRGAYGIQAAAKTYFSKDVSQLDLKESAYLAGLIRTPSTGDIYVDPDTAYFLRTSVLRNMVRSKAVTQAQADEVEAVRIETYVFRPQAADTTFTNVRDGAEYFVEEVRQQLVERFGEDRVLRGGLRVTTTLDAKIQAQAYEAVYGTLDRDDDPRGALVSLDPEGRVVAMVGNRRWSESQVNLAMGEDGGGGGRQAGSAFKPFVLAEALKAGISPYNRYFSGPAKIGPLKGWDDEVHNYDDQPYGYLNLVDATAYSVNTIYAQVVGLQEVGPERVVQTAHEMGIKSPLLAVPSITLGTQNVSVLEMANAYLTIANDGVRVEPRMIAKVTEDASVLVDDRPEGRTRVLERQVARDLKEILTTVVDKGSGTAARLPGGAWGKTGTTENFGDAWFVGGNGGANQLVTAVWMGYQEGQSRAMRDVHQVRRVAGGTWPAAIFKTFMTQAAPGDGNTYARPTIDPRSLSSGGPPTTARSTPATTSPPTTEVTPTTALPVQSPPSPPQSGSVITAPTGQSGATATTVTTRPATTASSVTIPDISIPPRSVPTRPG